MFSVKGLKGFEKYHCDSLEKEQGPEEYLGDLKEEIEKLQKRVEETTDPIKNAVQGWFDMSLQILVKISNNILQDLDQEQQKLFSDKAFNQEIIDMEGQILVLKGASTEQGNAFPEEVSFQVNVQKKMKELQRLSNSLKSPDIDDFKKRLNEILFFSEKAIERIRIPAFINVRLYQMLDIDVSTTISSMSLLSRPQGRISVP